MKINESKVEQVAGIVLFAISSLLWFVIIPMQIKDVTASGVPPRFLPQLVTLLIMMLSVPLFIGGWRKRDKENQKMYSLSLGELKLVVITLLAVTVTIMLYIIMGFIPSSILLLIFLQYKFGQRNKLKITVVSVALPVGIYMFFYYILMISLPMGMFYY